MQIYLLVLVLELRQFNFYRGLTRNPEIGDTPVCVFLNIWRLGQVRNTKFGNKVSNKMLLNAAKCQGYSFFTVSKLLRENQHGGGELPPTHPSHRDWN